MRQIRPFLVALALVAAAAPTAVAQLPKAESGILPPLAEIIPDTVLGYYRLEDPIGDFEKLMGSGDVWSRPQKMSEKTRRASERGLKEADKALNLQDGAMDSWMRSIGSVELALFSLDFSGGDDGPPMPDFAAVLQSSLAIEMYNQIATMMIDRGLGARDEQGRMQLGLAEGMTPLFAIYGDRVVLASSQSRLDEMLKAAKLGMQNSLASSPHFKAVCGSAKGPRIGFMRMASLLGLIRDALPEGRQKRMDDVIGPLGLTKLDAIGYREDGPNGIVTMHGDQSVRLFQLLKGRAGRPTLQMSLPAETAASFAHAADFGPHLRRIEGFLTDKAEFPFAAAVSTGITFLGVRLGMSTETLLEPLKDGFVFALVPDERGRIDPEQAMVLVAGTPVQAEAEKLLERLKRSYAKANRCEVEETIENDVRWIREKPNSRTREGAESRATEDPPPPPPGEETDDRLGPDGARVIEVRVGSDSGPTVRSRRRRSRFGPAGESAPDAGPPYVIAYDGKVMTIGLEGTVRRVLAARRGALPTLASTGAYARLPEAATFFGTFSLKGLFGNDGGFGAALSMLKEFGAIGMAVVAEDTKLVMTFNRAPGQMFGLMMGAGLAGEDGRDQKDVVMEELRKISAKAKAYREKNQKWPRSLADLGYEKTPTFPDEDGKQKPIVFLPPKATDRGDWNSMLAYWECSDFGRLVASTEGFVSTWSESRFQQGLADYNTMK
jgi:hypothetical protein